MRPESRGERDSLHEAAHAWRPSCFLRPLFFVLFVGYVVWVAYVVFQPTPLVANRAIDELGAR